ncbi:peroxiredoxin [Thiosulfatimonas sediminis]|uniref:thioredoxin-dependent peroxiredoxin n=1 Tax=Thiosulfatimonas sediminis TaxID=2675054 RepID=A0A6F8PU64_9GAMM|nr:peroxiredoxin [Thiosulfatimonas sediminis]BBP45682.1 peroxiredoxin [Thiosulfatimonas sediminis]
MLAEGATLPDFTLHATSNQTLCNADFVGRYSVIYVYPKDSTPGCTTEGLDFSALADEFKQLNAQIFGLSLDSLRRHENFKNKQNFAFDLISDPQAELCQALGVYQLKKNFGKEYMGLVRSTFLVDPQGTIIRVWSPVKINGHAQEVLQTLKNLCA